MKKRIGKITIASILVLVAVLAGWVYYATAGPGPYRVYHSSWYLVRATADEDGAAFVDVYDLTTEGNFASKDSSSVANGGPFRFPSMNETGDTKWMFVICGKNYNNVDDTFSFRMIGWSRENGMLQTLGEGDGVLGTQSVQVFPDGGDALGEEFSVTDANWVHGDVTLTVTNGGFDGGVVNTMVYVGSSNETKLTSGFYEISTFTDANTVIIAGAGTTANITSGDITVQNNPSFWADTINLDETTKWPRDGDANNITVYNSGDNETAFIIVETKSLEWIQFVIYAADAATSEEAGDITVYGRRL